MNIENIAGKRGNTSILLQITRIQTILNSLPNDKFLDWSKLKAHADDKINLAEKLKFVLGRVENGMGKGENAGDQHFLLFR